MTNDAKATPLFTGFVNPMLVVLPRLCPSRASVLALLLMVASGCSGPAVERPMPLTAAEEQVVKKLSQRLAGGAVLDLETFDPETSQVYEFGRRSPSDAVETLLETEGVDWFEDVMRQIATIASTNSEEALKQRLRDIRFGSPQVRTDSGQTVGLFTPAYYSALRGVEHEILAKRACPPGSDINTRVLVPVFSSPTACRHATFHAATRLLTVLSADDIAALQGGTRAPQSELWRLFQGDVRWEVFKLLLSKSLRLTVPPTDRDYTMHLLLVARAIELRHSIVEWRRNEEQFPTEPREPLSSTYLFLKALDAHWLQFLDFQAKYVFLLARQAELYPLDLPVPEQKDPNRERPYHFFQPRTQSPR